MAIRILLVDDQPLLRTGFRTVLDARDDLHVVGETGDGAEAVRLARRLLPDVVLMNAQLAGTGSVAATRALVESRPSPRVLIRSSSDLDDCLVATLRAGASGVLPEDTPPQGLVAAVRAVAAGAAVLPPRLLRRLLDGVADGVADGLADPHPVAAPLTGILTEREREVLVHLARGLSNVEIAEALSVGETTVKTHVGRLLAKLGVRDRVQAVVLAYESGLVRPVG